MGCRDAPQAAAVVELPHARIWCMGSVSRQVVLHVGDVGSAGIEARFGALWKHTILLSSTRGIMSPATPPPLLLATLGSRAASDLFVYAYRLGWWRFCRPAARGVLNDQVFFCLGWLPTY